MAGLAEWAGIIMVTGKHAGSVLIYDYLPVIGGQIGLRNLNCNSNIKALVPNHMAKL